MFVSMSWGMSLLNSIRHPIWLLLLVQFYFFYFFFAYFSFLVTLRGSISDISSESTELLFKRSLLLPPSEDVIWSKLYWIPMKYLLKTKLHKITTSLPMSRIWVIDKRHQTNLNLSASWYVTHLNMHIC